MPNRYRWSIYVIVAIGLLALSACSRRDSEPKARPETFAEPATAVPRTRTLRDLGLDVRVEAAIKENPTWNANQFLAHGDGLKSIGQYAEAAIAYLAALHFDPKHLYGRYQLACNLSLWGEEDLAMASLLDVVRDGFWGYEMMKDDDDLERVKQKPQFHLLLEEVKKRYPAEASKRTGKSYLCVPQGQAPAKGWPIVLFLHGYGDRSDSYVGLAEAATRNGFAGVAAPGPIVQWENRYRWPTDSFAVTHTYLQSVLDGYRDHKDLDRGRVFLCGLSQGATQGVGLVASFPESYEGAIAVSPGGMSPVPTEVKPSARPRPLYVTYGDQEAQFVVQRAGQCMDLWKQAGHPVLLQSHPGGHQFPADWGERFPRILEWLQDPKGAS